MVLLDFLELVRGSPKSNIVLIKKKSTCAYIALTVPEVLCCVLYSLWCRELKDSWCASKGYPHCDGWLVDWIVGGRQEAPGSKLHYWRERYFPMLRAETTMCVAQKQGRSISTAIARKNKTEMFFTLGLPALITTFWCRSLFDSNSEQEQFSFVLYTQVGCVWFDGQESSALLAYRPVGAGTNLVLGELIAVEINSWKPVHLCWALEIKRTAVFIGRFVNSITCFCLLRRGMNILSLYVKGGTSADHCERDAFMMSVLMFTSVWVATYE